MEQAQITYTVMRNDKGTIFLYKDGGRIGIRDIPENMALITFLEVDLQYALKEKNKPTQP